MIIHTLDCETRTRLLHGVLIIRQKHMDGNACSSHHFASKDKRAAYLKCSGARILTMQDTPRKAQLFLSEPSSSFLQ